MKKGKLSLTNCLTTALFFCIIVVSLSILNAADRESMQYFLLLVFLSCASTDSLRKVRVGMRWLRIVSTLQHMI